MTSLGEPTTGLDSAGTGVPSGVRQQLKRLGSSSIIYGLGSIAGRLVGFLLLPLMTSYLRPADYGLYSILTLWSFLATSIFSFGLNAGIVGSWFFERAEPEWRETVLSTVLALLLVSGAVLSALAILAARPLAALYLIDGRDAWLLTVSLVATAINILAIPPSMRLMFDNRPFAFVLISGTTTLTTVLLNVWMVVGLRRGVSGLVEAGFIGQTLGTLLFFVPSACRHFRMPDARLALRVLRQSLPLIPGTGVLLLLQHGNKYLMQWYGQSEQLGIYSIGFNFGMFMQLPLSAFQTAWYPYFTSFVGKPDEVKSLFGRLTSYYVLAFGCLSLMFYVVAKPVVLVMTQPAFHPAYVVVGLSSTAQLLLSIHVVLLPGAYFAKEFGIQTGIQTAALAVCAAASALLIPAAGLVGASLGLVIGAAAVLALTVAWNRYRRDRYPVIDYERGRLAKFGVLYTIIAVVAVRPPVSLGVEFLIAGALALATAAAGYWCLTGRERQMLIEPVVATCRQWMAVR